MAAKMPAVNSAVPHLGIGPSVDPATAVGIDASPYTVLGYPSTRAWLTIDTSVVSHIACRPLCQFLWLGAHFTEGNYA